MALLLTSLTRRSFDVPRAFKAARALAANPDDLPQVFTIIDALSGPSLAWISRRCASTPSGRRLLAEKPDIVARLADRAALARLPAGSLGRAYLDFVVAENISPAGILDASREGHLPERVLAPPLDYVHARLRDTHDLWHALTGYHGDVLGESALLAFTLAQARNPGIALIVGVGLVKLPGHSETRRVIFDGFRRGRKAAWLPSLEWESLLERPLEEVRAKLDVEPPARYSPIRSEALRTRGVCA